MTSLIGLCNIKFIQIFVAIINYDAFFLSFLQDSGWHPLVRSIMTHFKVRTRGLVAKT